jgi:5-methylcytosine-specific restriction endonuclease McrA
MMEFIEVVTELRDLCTRKKELEKELVDYLKIMVNDSTTVDVIINTIYKDKTEKRAIKNQINPKIQEIKQLLEMPYSEYLKTDHWQRIRKKALKTAQGKCQVCNSGNQKLDVHHRTYERRGQEYRRDVIVLCRSCHENFISPMK